MTGRSSRSISARDIVPRPRYARMHSGPGVVIDRTTKILVGASLARDRWALGPLLKKLGRAPGSVRTVSPGRCEPPDGCVLAGSAADHPELRALLKRLEDHLPRRSPGDEGYVVSVRPSGVRIVADAPAGIFHAVQTLLQTAAIGRGKAVLPSIDIADAPAYPFRGYHLPGGGMTLMPQIMQIVAEVLPRHKVNTFVFGLGYRFTFKSHPEIYEKPMVTRRQAKQLLRLCRENNIKLIPILNCFGHQSSASGRPGGLLRAYPEFDETPGKEGCPTGHNWCPTNRRIYPIIDDLLDEFIEVFEADTVHVGMDEVFQFGQCRRCRGMGPAESYAHVVNRLYSHLVERRGVKMMMWGDRLIDGRKTPYNLMNGARNGTHPALYRIPRDIFICDWHYHLHDEYPSAPRFNRAGFDFVSCGYQKPRAVKAFISYAAERGGRHYRGHLDTNWGPVKPGVMSLLRGTTGKVGSADAFRTGLELAWRGV